MIKSIVVLLATTLITSAVIQFDNAAIEKIFQNKEQKAPVLLLFASDNEESKAARQAFQDLDEQGLDLILTVSDQHDGHGLFEKLVDFVGINKDVTPQVLELVDKKNKYIFQGDITKDNLKQFIQKVKAGEIKKTLKSDPIPQHNNQPVKIVVGKNFQQIVLDSQKQVLVKFYAPWCGHCKNLAPHYDEAAKRLQVNQNIILIKIDSTANQVESVEIEAFPTLKFYGKDKSQPPIDYNGARDTEGIIDWLKEHTEYPWKVLQEGKQTLEQL